MAFKAFLLKLVGKHPVQLEEQERFERSMEGLEEQKDKLDSLLDDIRGVSTVVRSRSDAYEESATSMRPQEDEREEPGEVSVSVEEFSTG